MISLKKVGYEIFNEYIKKLGITLEDANKIIYYNKSAQIFLTGESGLRMRSSEKNLSILLRTTIFRDFNDFEPIREEEVKKIRRYYGIYIKPIAISQVKFMLADAKKVNKNFVKDCLECEAELGDIEEYINEWIEGEYECDLNVFLGMTEDEYGYWKEDKSESRLRHIIHCHEYNKNINQFKDGDTEFKMVARARNSSELKAASSKVKEIAGRRYEKRE